MKRYPFIAALLALVVAPMAARAQVPQLVSYQGVLTDGAGNLVPDGLYDVTFRFFSVSVGGAILHDETHIGVPVSKGGFSVLIGSVLGDPLVLPFTLPYWLEIQVAPDPLPLTPRIQLASSPYTQMAETVLDNAITSAKILDGTIGIADIGTNFIATVDGVVNDGGNVDLVAASGITITPDDVNNRVTIGQSAPAYVIEDGLNTMAVNVTTTWTKLDDFITFTKARASSVVEVSLHTRAFSGTFAGGANGIRYAIRIDDVESAISGNAAITTSGTTHFVTAFAAFTGLSTGLHTVSVWARTAFGSSNGVLLDPAGWGGHLVVKELD